MASTQADKDRLRQLAESVDCITDEDLAILADTKLTTVEAWRKRGMGPSYILIGNRFLYQKKVVSEYLSTLVRERGQQPIGGAL